MCKEMIKKIYDISEKCGTDKIAIITNHLKIVGTLCKEDGQDKDKDDYILSLLDAKIWRIGDICTCKEQDCKCDEATFFPLPFLHVNLEKIVGYSILTE